MKIDSSDIDVTSENILESHSYGIRTQDMGLILDILRKKMYKDPIMAFCREISCNAKDAHIEVGTPDKPIKIIVPTMLIRKLTIRDFGTGISPDRIKDIFINFGASTKRNSNDQIGGFGMGAKTPFAYTDSFSVETICDDGIKRTYACYIDPSQAGKMDLIREEITEEHSGTAIIIPIKKADIDLVKAKLAEVTTYWRIRPECNLDLPYPTIEEPVLAGDSWAIHDGLSYGYYNSINIIIEGIHYKAEMDLVITYDHPLYNTKITLYFKIGELSLSSNRDTIHFNKKTKDRIKERLDDLFAELPLAIENKLVDSTLLEAEEFFSKISRCVTSKKISPKWRDTTLKGMERNFNNFKLHNSIKGNFLISLFGHRSLYINGKHTTAIRRRNESSLDISSKEIYLNDKMKDKMSVPRDKIISYMNEHDIKELYIISFSDNETKDLFYKGLDLNYLDIKPISRINPKIKVKNPRVQRRSDFDAYTFDISHAPQRAAPYWKPQIVKKNDGSGIYIEIKSKINKEYYAGIIKFDESIYQCAEKLLNQKIYGIPTRYIHLLGPGWKRLDDVVLPLFQSHLNGFNIAEAKNDIKHRRFSLNYKFKHFYDLIDKTRLNDDSLFLKYILKSDSVISSYSENKAKLSIVENIDIKFNYKNKISKSFVNLGQLYEDVKKRYSLLDYIYKYDDGIPVYGLIQYIQLIDSAVNNSLSIGRVA